MAIAQQTATPAGLLRQRHALVEVATPARSRSRTLAKIFALIAATSLGTALVVSVAGVGLLMVVTSLIK